MNRRISIAMTAILFFLTGLHANAQTVTDTASGKPKVTPIVLDGKLSGVFNHSFFGDGGHHATVTTGNFAKFKMPFELPEGLWMVNLSTVLTHKNAQLRIWIETTEGSSESFFMNGFNTGPDWQTININHWFSGVKADKTKRAELVFIVSAVQGTTVEVEQIFNNISAFKIKKVYKNAE
jgi:hypothetical protein